MRQSGLGNGGSVVPHKKGKTTMRSNVGPADPQKLMLMLQLLTATTVTPDMVQRGLIAYNNHRALHSGTGWQSDQQMVEELLKAAIGGHGKDSFS